MNADDLDSEEFSNKFSDYFEFRAILGKGAFGVVISALRKSDNKEYAVKVIQKQNVSSADWDRLRQEAFILSDLNHPNIVRFKDIIETERRIFLVMELVQGGQLRHLIEARRRNHVKFTDDEASTIMKSILKAVQYLHTKEVVHRDLKPENILVQDWKHLTSIKIADFGLSAQFTEDTFMRSFRQKCGTMIYMAPEQALEQQYSKPVDIWSCGLIMYILLANGKHPLYEKSDTPTQYIEKLKSPEWIFGDYFTPLAQNFFLKLMHTDSVVRYTAEDALKHPWITRRFNDQIPLSAHEVMTSFSVEQSFSRILKAMYMATHLTSGEDDINKNSGSQVSEDYKALVEKLSEEQHQKAPPTNKKSLGNSIMLQYDSLQSLLGLVSPHHKESPAHSQFAKKKEASPIAANQEKNSPVTEESKDMIRKISLFEERVDTDGDNINNNMAVFGAAKDTITLPKIRESPKINIYTPDVGEKPSFMNILDNPTNPQPDELADAQTTQETIPSISAEHRLVGLTIDNKSSEIFEGMKNFLNAGISKSTRDSTKQNFSLQFSYEDQGFDSDAPQTTKLVSPNVSSRKRAPSVSQLGNNRAESSNNTSYASEDSSESTSSVDPQKPSKDESQKGLKKSPFFHSAQKPLSSGKGSQMSGDKAYPFSLIKSPTNNVSTSKKSKTKDFTLPQIVATSTPKGSGTGRSKGSDKSFVFKSPERINKATFNSQTPSAQSTRLPFDMPEAKMHTKNFSMPQKNFRSSNDLLSLATLNVKDISHTSQGRRLSTLKDDPKNQNTFL